MLSSPQKTNFNFLVAIIYFSVNAFSLDKFKILLYSKEWILFLLLTLHQGWGNFKLFQIESICRQQIKYDFND